MRSAMDAFLFRCVESEGIVARDPNARMLVGRLLQLSSMVAAVTAGSDGRGARNARWVRVRPVTIFYGLYTALETALSSPEVPQTRLASLVSSLAVCCKSFSEHFYSGPI